METHELPQTMEQRLNEEYEKCIRSFRAARYKRELELSTRDLRRRIEELESQVEFLGNESFSAGCKVVDASLQYSKIACPNLCNKIMLTFPREIRDIIYFYFIGHGLWAPAGSQMLVRDLDSLRTKAVQWTKDFVGASMAREMAETFYRTTKFIFTSSDATAIYRLRLNNEFGLDFLPVSFISDIEYRISLYSVEIPGYPIDPRADLEFLFGFRPGTAITMMLARQEWLLVDDLTFIFPVFQRLMDLKYRIRVSLELERNFPDVGVKFISEWNPVSAQAVIEAYWKKRVDAEEELQQAKLDEQLAIYSDMTWDMPTLIAR
ncbi:5 -methylthioadenosine phosphorylase [Pyrenophora seminiperda CCB06]|uniref:5-methylthioadenosine phosphorylase n=1 Tax=Pyrenophora seminiperda CCB06 TaxID=1302712 RepID=A0A3M7M2K3_9PLEO|nr:5 -methylthioadenosine phosphorylase [Pyrenophora seminiperda CCB06]